jgi:dihydroorotase
LPSNPSVSELSRRGLFRLAAIAFAGHGSGSFSFHAVQAALRQDCPPSSISSDIHSWSVLGPAFDMVTTMSKLLMLGLPLASVIERSTTLSARAIQRGDLLGSLQPRRPADITVLQQTDSKRQSRTAMRKLIPVLALRDGKAALESRAAIPASSIATG